MTPLCETETVYNIGLLEGEETKSSQGSLSKTSMKPIPDSLSVLIRALLLGLSLVGAAAKAQDPLFKFTGKDSGDPKNWQKSLNWELNGEPATRVPGTGPDDRVIIPGNEVTNPSSTVKSLSLGGSITGGSLSIRESLSLLGGTFRGCTVTILDHATMTSSASGLNGFDSCTVINRGIFAPQRVGLGALPSLDPTVLINDPLTGSIELQDGSSIGSNQGGIIQSGGVFVKRPGPGEATVAGVHLLQLISGIVECQGGTLRVGSPNPSPGSFVCDRPIVLSAPDAIIDISGANSELRIGTRITGPGKALIRHVLVSGPIQVENMEIPPNASLEGPGDLAVLGLLSVNGGSLLGSAESSGATASLTIQNGGTLRFAPNQNGATLGRSLRNSGRVLQDMGVSPGLPLGSTASFTVENMPEGIIELNSTGGLASRGLKNRGTLRKSTNTALTTDQFLSSGCENTGVIDIRTGLLRFLGLTQTAGELRVSSGAEARFQGPGAVFSGGLISGAGTLRGLSSSSPIRLACPVRPNTGPGNLTIIRNEDSVTSDASARYEFSLTGSVAGTDYPQLILNQIGGNFPLSGTVAVTYGNGFFPKVGQVFSVIRYSAGRAGEFSGFEGLTATPGIVLVPKYTSSGLDLVTVVTPGLTLTSVTSTSALARFQSASGVTYQFETSKDLFNWVVTGEAIPGDGRTQDVVLHFAAGPVRFFRLRLN